MPQPLPPESIPERVIARIITTFGVQVGLLAAKPNWESEVKITQDLPTDVSKEPITFVESRRNFAAYARYHMEWTSYLSSAVDATELRMFLLRIREIPTFVPLWPDVCEVSTDVPAHATNVYLVDLPARYTVAWIITDENFTTWEIFVSNVLDLVNKRVGVSGTGGLSRAYPAGSLVYPLLAGRLEEQPKPEAITDETLEVTLKMKENSAFYNRISPASTTIRTVGGNIPKFQNTYLWHVIPNHVRPLDWTEMPTIVYEAVGFLRQEQQRVYPHPTPRGQELEFYQSDRTSIAEIEYFWRVHRATTLRFMIPTFRGDLRMSHDTPYPAPNQKLITCERSFFSNPGRELEPSDPFIALIDKNDVITPYQLALISDVPPDATHLWATVNIAAFAQGTTILSHLMLARFQEATLEWSYTTPYLATTRIKFVEVPDEYPTELNPNPPVPLIEPAYLFAFFEAGVRADLFTSYETAITIQGQTYVPAPFSFDTVKVGLKLDQEKLELKSFKFDGNPLNKLWPFALDGILTVLIMEVDSQNPSSAPAVVRFYGEVWSVDSTWKATIIPFGNLFDRKFPRFLLSVSDNYTEFSPPTQLPASAFKITAAINGAPVVGSQTLPIKGGSTLTVALADWFAGGWLETGTGANKEKRGILHSTAATGSPPNVLVSLTIDRPLLKAVANQALDTYPGYDGSILQCDAKFNNRINFGGHAYIPNVNPGVKAVKTKNAAGGKKG